MDSVQVTIIIVPLNIKEGAQETTYTGTTHAEIEVILYNTVQMVATTDIAVHTAITGL